MKTFEGAFVSVLVVVVVAFSFATYRARVGDPVVLRGGPRGKQKTRKPGNSFAFTIISALHALFFCDCVFATGAFQ